MINLRNYQNQMIDDVGFEFNAGHKRVCMVGPCGCGKTVMVGWMVAGTVLQGRRVLFLVHRQELIDQASATFTDMGICHGIIAAKQPAQYEKLAQIASVQTVVRRLDKMPAPDYIIIDESHHVLAATYRRILDHYPDAYVLGVTATPERMGGQGLGDIFQSLTIGPSVRELIDWGNLAPFDLYAPPAKFDASLLRVKFGDYVREDLQLAMDDNTIIGDLIESYHKYATGLKAIVYCVSLQHSEHVAASFREAGIAAAHIDGETPKMVREQIIKDFRSGRIQILCNVDLISEGFDVPSAGAVILARPTQSLTLFIQQAMRAMRPDTDNPTKRAVIIDHVGNVFRHGMPDDDRAWTLESKKKRKKSYPIIKYKSKFAHAVTKCIGLQRLALIAASFIQ